MAGSGSVAVVQKQLAAKKIKRDVDVRELYLADQNLSDVMDMSLFVNLNQLWLSNNKLCQLGFLRGNLRISELHLDGNRLKDISGQLQHLTCLQVLSLQNNQLERLEKVVAECRNMQRLIKLNLFNNPVAQENGYRVYVIHYIPSLKLLDRQEVLKLEKDLGNKLYNQTQEDIKETIAFGRRSQGPPSLYYPAELQSPVLTKPKGFEFGNNYHKNIPAYDTEEHAIAARTRVRSLMQWSYFDWSKVPRSDERRLTDKPVESHAQIITMQFQ